MNPASISLCGAGRRCHRVPLLSHEPCPNDFVFDRRPERSATLPARHGPLSWPLPRLCSGGAAGPLFHFSETWQLIINTGTTIVTFLMVFLIQNSQNRDTAAMQIKLDELIRAVHGAHNALLDLEEMEEADINRVRAGYRELAQIARKDLRKGGADTACPDVGESL